MMTRILFSLSLLLFSFSYSQEWKFLFNESNRTYYYKTNDETTAWIKIVSNKIEYYQSGILKSIDGYKLMLYKFQCNSKRIGVKQIIVYSKKGKLMRKMTEKDNLVDMQYAPKKSNARTFLNVFCNIEN
ncbi:hypothetical protein J2X97_003671 [Epilithonimonas hungarica]|uniref:hypothetical protein n=1 Tax=Epilithonimonas hungarica TaxID=454006 RepID=UPI0027831BA0|nr:hypothetical protein [Epilithonimonas hungarica]MDP9957997.1 hypothetical protein [Epilithonimonas hungarica]